MRDTWLSFGCFLTGFNRRILKSCSELSAKRVIRYTSALLIVCLLWAFIGFAFADRYLKAPWYACFTASLIMVFLIIQIERQIILSSRKNKLLHVFRLVIAFSMALIGTVIIDQIIFKDDIERRKIATIGEDVKTIFPSRAEELKRQIDEIDAIILKKENEHRSITEALEKKPFVTAYEVQTKTDTSKNPIRTTIRKQVPNPKANLLAPLDRNISDLRDERIKKDSMLLGLRTVIEAELKENVGFLDELDVMYALLSESGVSFFAWLIWLVFLLGLELFILASKIGETDNDYDLLMKQQMELHFKRIQLLDNPVV